MQKLSLIALLLVMVCASSAADELLIAGTVEKVTDRLTDHSANCKAGAGNTEHVCVSNSCGTEIADIKIDRRFAGTGGDNKTLHIETPFGEWCKPVFAVSPNPVLVQLIAGEPHWSSIMDKQGKQFIEARAFRSIAGVDMKNLPADADGLVPLERLLAALAQKKE